MDKPLIGKVSLIIAMIVFLIITMVAIAVWLFTPVYKKIFLGQDAKIVVRLVVEVVTAEALAVETDMRAAQLRGFFNDGGIKYEKVVRKGFSTIEITGALPENERTIRDILASDFPEWNYAFNANLVALTMRPDIELQLCKQAVDQAMVVIRDRLDQFGIANAIVKKEGHVGDKIIIELPALDNPERVKGLIKSTAILEFREVVSGPFLTEEEALKNYNGLLPDDLEIVRTNRRRLDMGFYVLKTATVVSGRDLKSARRAQDEYGAPAVGFSFNSQGARQFERFTAANIGKQLSIVLDDRIESVATIQDVISGDGIIKGRFTVDEVDDIVLVLRSGALPAPLKYLEERRI